ncbi:hypothetical protein OJ967_02100 [Peribacillus frigoritolerans]|uniref:hypothetical protein n=1 Tax=Peribacillus frigoritolerans TaxID=450367 RepID=UPI002226846A|nr:hypothetical protein [Peribacillus frigoritolerans]UYY99379.1 hypothetical protein OJ967_02100 [Peribacillus frigoritolerans]
MAKLRIYKVWGCAKQAVLQEKLVGMVFAYINKSKSRKEGELNCQLFGFVGKSLGENDDY